MNRARRGRARRTHHDEPVPSGAATYGIDGAQQFVAAKTKKAVRAVSTELSKLDSEFPESGERKGACMSTIHLHQTTSSTPEQYIAGLTDFGPGAGKRGY
jgi:hypothetical protein